MGRRICLNPRRGFTLVDLLVAIALAVLLFTYVLFATHSRGDRADRVKCSSNLRQIGQALLLYAQENGGNFPRTLYNRDDPIARAYTGVSAHNPFAADGPKANDVTAALHLLLRTQDLTPMVFVCPTTERVNLWDFGGKGNTAFDRSNFPSDHYLSYSVSNPYPSAAAASDGYRWTNTLRADFAIVADLNPGSPEVTSVTPTSSPKALQAANSLNHHREGQNILYGDGHVDFQQSPFQGVQQDNIYGPGRVLNPGTPDQSVDPLARGNLNSSPGHKDDSVLLPVATFNPGPTEFQLFVRSFDVSTVAGWAFVCFAAVWVGIRWVGPVCLAVCRRMSK